MTMINQIQAARRTAAPIVAVTTSDPASTVRNITAVYASEPLAKWNIVDGIIAVNSRAQGYVTQMHTVDGQTMPAAMITSNPVEALRLSSQWLPENSILFFHNAHHYIEPGPGDSHKPVIQAVWNTRDAWMKNRRTLVLLAPAITIPVELRNDVILIEDPLPSDKEYSYLIARGVSRGSGKKSTKMEKAKLVSAVAGLAAFNAESVVAMSISPKTKRPDMDMVWEQKIKIIEQTRGLRVHRSGPKFSDIGGNQNIKDLLTKVARGLYCPDLVVFLDEVEKMLAAAGMDTSGTTTDQLKVLLTEMQNWGWTGMAIYGFSGTGKSQLAKAFGNECGCPTVEADLPSMKNIWVGSSEANMRQFMRTIQAMGRRKIFFIATCNSVVNLPPEFKRRFKNGVWFCDVPDRQEKDDIWKIYFKKYNIPDATLKPDDAGWVGAEIELCCQMSHELGISLIEASGYMTITTQAMGDQVEKMREAAHGKFINANHPGIYQYIKPVQPRKQSFMDKLKGGE